MILKKKMNFKEKSISLTNNKKHKIMAKTRKVSAKKKAATGVKKALAGKSFRLKHGYEVVVRKTKLK